MRLRPPCTKPVRAILAQAFWCSVAYFESASGLFGQYLFPVVVSNLKLAVAGFGFTVSEVGKQD